MKSALTTTMIVFGALGLLGAKDDPAPAIPKEKAGRWGIYSHTEAQEEATKKKRPIVYLVHDERAEEASEKEAANKAFWALAKDCTIVVVPSRLIGEAKNRCGETVYAAISSKEIGKGSPRLAVMDQAGGKLLGQMDKDTIINTDDKAFKVFARQMEDFNKDPSKVPATAAAPAAPASPTAAPAAPAAPAPATATTPAAPAGPVTIKGGTVEAWKSAQGTTIQATLTQVTADTATLVTADGRTLSVPLASLAAESLQRVEALKAASAK
jgi:hypothetical protein